MQDVPDSEHFVATLHPLLEKRDISGLLDALQQNWSCPQLQSLLERGSGDAKKVAALALGLVGDQACCQKLAPLLHDADAVVVQMAEHALWSIWFRGGNEQANGHLQTGAAALDAGDLPDALKHFNAAIAADEDFTEAYNQRALTGYLMEDFAASICDCRRVIERMPMHFGAWCGLGHCHAHLGELRQALDAYRHALLIHPRLDRIRQAAEMLACQCENP